jgi:hypothetical protein
LKDEDIEYQTGTSSQSSSLTPRFALESPGLARL